MPFEWVVALRFLREGRFQTVLIVGGVAAGVAVFIFITALVNGLQGNTIRRTLGTQAHIVVRPAEEVAHAQRTVPPGVESMPRFEARAQRLRSIDQWQPLERELGPEAGVTAVSPLAPGPGTLRLAAGPNPSRGAVTFSIAVPAGERADLRVYDLGGREVIRLAGGESGATGGPQAAARWDGRDARGNAVSAGIYVARLSAGGKSTATRFVVLR